MANSSNILITHDLDGAALAAPVDAARRNGAAYKTRTIDDLRIKDDRLRAAIEARDTCCSTAHGYHAAGGRHEGRRPARAAQL